MVPKVSIIIVNYNTKKLVVNCIESIKISKPRVTYEVIIVDNGSIDGSDEILKDLDGIRTIFNKKNLGFSKANNKGINIAKGKHVLLLNTDTKATKGAIDALFEFAENKSDVGVVGSRLLNTDGTTQDSVFHFPSVTGAIKQYWYGEKGHYGQYHTKSKKPVKVDAVVGASFFITKEALKRVGVLDERYFMYFEDLDYCRRVWKSGLKVYYLPSSEVIHYHGESGKELADNKSQWKRLVPSSKIYHGPLVHSLINFVLWSGQKLRK